MELKPIKITILLFILWNFCVVDVYATKNQRGVRKRGKGKDRLRLVGLSFKRSRKFKLQGNSDSDKLPFEVFSQKPKFQPPGKMRPGGSDSGNRGLLFPGTIRPSPDQKGHFVVSRRNHIKKEWCKTKRTRQVIREKGCLSRTILNNYCYGQCNSFYIPSPESRTVRDPSAFVSCGFCKPIVHSSIRVTLLCPGKKFTRHKRKRVLKVKKCSCMAQKVDIS